MCIFATCLVPQLSPIYGNVTYTGCHHVAGFIHAHIFQLTGNQSTQRKPTETLGKHASTLFKP